ncbi:dihydrofolate reductase family protein [uncultured Ferrovibrio sp.]|jgi:dihydrofolate reductase|uniref:dihydrofolate reductase family protein n=1 Tax=uncultured Ferrovibrio sp. TaxID=1576913 RepID=UPI00262DBC68|nr:dihydrofolate reductase family protein [uncultured Ferrovibrio sp.]
MRKVIAAAFVSLDGVMQAPGGAKEDTSSGFSLGGWVWPYSDAVTQAAVMSLFAQPFELLLGRRTYDIFAAYWPKAAEDHPIGGPFNRTRKYVASRNPKLKLAWRNSHALIDTSRGADAIAAVRALRSEDGPDLLTQGSADFLKTLFRLDLVDEMQVMIFPITLGTGKRLFGEDGSPGAWRLLRAEVSGTGVAVHRYARAGAVVTGEAPA